MLGLATRVPREAYLQMRQGKPVLCGNLAEIYVALCEAAGLTARVVGLSVLVRDGYFRVETHAAAEIWIPEMGGWVFQDPTFNCYWEIYLDVRFDVPSGGAFRVMDVIVTEAPRFAAEDYSSIEPRKPQGTDVRLHRPTKRPTAVAAAAN